MKTLRVVTGMWQENGALVVQYETISAVACPQDSVPIPVEFVTLPSASETVTTQLPGSQGKGKEKKSS